MHETIERKLDIVVNRKASQLPNGTHEQGTAPEPKGLRDRQGTEITGFDAEVAVQAHEADLGARRVNGDKDHNIRPLSRERAKPVGIVGRQRLSGVVSYKENVEGLVRFMRGEKWYRRFVSGDRIQRHPGNRRPKEGDLNSEA